MRINFPWGFLELFHVVEVYAEEHPGDYDDKDESKDYCAGELDNELFWGKGRGQEGAVEGVGHEQGHVLKVDVEAKAEGNGKIFGDVGREGDLGVAHCCLDYAHKQHDCKHSGPYDSNANDLIDGSLL